MNNYVLFQNYHSIEIFIDDFDTSFLPKTIYLITIQMDYKIAVTSNQTFEIYILRTCVNSFNIRSLLCTIDLNSVKRQFFNCIHNICRFFSSEFSISTEKKEICIEKIIRIFEIDRNEVFQWFHSKSVSMLHHRSYLTENTIC